MIASGENPKAIQAFMGHATIQMTFDRYGHLMPGSRDQARARLDDYLASSASDRHAIDPGISSLRFSPSRSDGFPRFAVLTTG